MSLIAKQVDNGKTALFRGLDCIGVVHNGVFDCYVATLSIVELCDIIKYHDVKIPVPSLLTKPLQVCYVASPTTQQMQDMLVQQMNKIKTVNNPERVGPVNTVHDVNPSFIRNKRIAITGKIPRWTRQRLEQLVTGLNGHLVDVVNSSTDLVVIGNIVGGGSTTKRDEALRLGLHTMNGSAFLRLCGQR